MRKSTKIKSLLPMTLEFGNKDTTQILNRSNSTCLKTKPGATHLFYRLRNGWMQQAPLALFQNSANMAGPLPGRILPLNSRYG